MKNTKKVKSNRTTSYSLNDNTKKERKRNYTKKKTKKNSAVETNAGAFGKLRIIYDTDSFTPYLFAHCLLW